MNTDPKRTLTSLSQHTPHTHIRHSSHAPRRASQSPSSAPRLRPHFCPFKHENVPPSQLRRPAPRPLPFGAPARRDRIAHSGKLHNGTHGERKLDASEGQIFYVPLSLSTPPFGTLPQQLSPLHNHPPTSNRPPRPSPRHWLPPKKAPFLLSSSRSTWPVLLSSDYKL